PDPVHGAGVQFLDRAFAGDAVDALEVVLVVKCVAGAGSDPRDVKAEPHAVAGQQQPRAVPAVGLDETLALPGGVKITNDHCWSPYSAAWRCVPSTDS